MAEVARIVVKAFNAKTNEPILGRNRKPIIGTIECSTDVPAEYLGEATAETMQKAWATGLDGTDIKLEVTFL